MSGAPNAAAPGSWLAAFAASGLCAWGAHWLWQEGQRGSDASAVGAAGLAALAALFVLNGAASLEQRLAVRRLKRLMRQKTTTHGQARWGTVKDAQQAGMLSPSGVFLGRLGGRDLWFSGEGSLLTIAPPATGKSACLAIPTLLTYPGSIIVNDIKGELAAVTADHRRRRLGNQVIMLNPHRDRLREEMGADLGDDGFNPLSILKLGPQLKDEVELLASLLLPAPPGMSESETHFVDWGQVILACFVLFMMTRPTHPMTLPELRRLLMSSPEDLIATIVAMKNSSAFNGLLQEYAARLSTTLANGPKEFQAALTTAQRALRIYDRFGPLGQHVSQGSCRFEDAKRRPTTYYIINPGDRRETHGAWASLVISLAIELAGRDRSNKPVLFLLDEFANMYLPNVLRAVALYRGQGLRFWMMVQQQTMLERLYKEGARELLGMAELVNVIGAREPETLRMLSDWVGHETAQELSYSNRPEMASQQGGLDLSLSQRSIGRPLIRPEEVRTLPSNQQLIFYRNHPPFLAEKVSYLDVPQWRRWAVPNPYYRS